MLKIESGGQAPSNEADGSKLAHTVSEGVAMVAESRIIT